jgi:hypothetical protein
MKVILAKYMKDLAVVNATFSGEYDYGTLQNGLAISLRSG